jgi:hypothetical protein
VKTAMRISSGSGVGFDTTLKQGTLQLGFPTQKPT